MQQRLLAFHFWWSPFTLARELICVTRTEEIGQATFQTPHISETIYNQPPHLYKGMKTHHPATFQIIQSPNSTLTYIYPWYLPTLPHQLRDISAGAKSDIYNPPQPSIRRQPESVRSLFQLAKSPFWGKDLQACTQCLWL